MTIIENGVVIRDDGGRRWVKDRNAQHATGD
jgi:hypothetical protein